MYSMALIPVRTKYINLSTDYSPRLNIETVVQDMQVFYPKHVLDAAKYEYIDLLKTEHLLHTKYPEQFRSLVKSDDKVYVSETQFPTLSGSKLYQVLKTAERHRRSAWRNAMLEFISLQRIQKLYVQLESDHRYIKKRRDQPERVKIGLMGRLSPDMKTPPKSPNMIVTARSNRSPVIFKKDGFVSTDEYDDLRLELTKRDNAIQELTSRVSALANQHIYDGFPTFKYAHEIVNPTNIAEKFALVFENEWKSAYEDLADRGYHDEECVYKLMRVIRYAYPFCQQIAEDQIIELIHIMEHPNMRSKPSYMDKFREVPKILPPISTPRVSSLDTPVKSPLIGKPPKNTEYNRKPETEQPLFGAPLSVNVTKSADIRKRVSEDYSRSSRRSISEYKEHSSSQPPSLDLNENTTSPYLNRGEQTSGFDEKRYESRVTGRPVMKVLPVYNSQDKQSLEAQNKHLRELLQTQTEEILSLRNLDRENQNIVQNLKSRLSSCTCDDNPGSVDYTMNTSSTEIAQRFVDVYDNEYKSAVTILTTRYRDQLSEDVALYSMMEIIKRCYKLCTAVASEQVENMTSLMKDQVVQPCVTQHSSVQRKVSSNEMNRVNSDAERLARLFRKRHCTVTITNLNDKFNEELDKTVDFQSHLKTPEVSLFIEKCLEALWLMSNQDPAMSLMWPEQGDIFDTTLYKYYNRKGFKVNFPIWPAVLMYDKGPVLCKGFAVPM